MVAAWQYPRGSAAAVALAVYLVTTSAALAQRTANLINSPNGLRLNSPIENSSAIKYGSGSSGATVTRSGGGAPAGARNYRGLPSGIGGGASGLPGYSMPGLPGAGGGILGPNATTLYRATGPQTDMGRDMLSAEITRMTSPSQAGAALMSAFVLDKTAVLKQEGPAITSFVPTSLGVDSSNRYVELLIQGEQAMRSRRYRDAAAAFAQVRHVAPLAPESLLSQAHAEFGNGNYWLMANDIRLAILEFPELPLAKLELRAFFASSAEFVDLRDQLRQAAGAQEAVAAARRPAEAPPEVLHVDSSVLLSLAYVEWFDGNGQAAAKYLVRAARTSEDPLLSDAIETFWKAIVRAGAAQGRLVEQAGLVGPSPAAQTSAPAATPQAS